LFDDIFRAIGRVNFIGEATGSNPTIALYLQEQERACAEVTCASFFHLNCETQELFVQPSLDHQLQVSF